MTPRNANNHTIPKIVVSKSPRMSTNNQNYPNAVETSTIFGKRSPHRSPRKSNGSIDKSKLSQNLQQSSLNQSLITSVQYKPDNSPTNKTFLRNKYKGGSNEHEMPKKD